MLRVDVDRHWSNWQTRLLIPGGDKLINIIDRYIAKVFLGYFFAGLIVFVTLFITIDVLTNIIRFGAPTDVIINYYSNYIFEVVYQMTPVACLIGTVFTLSELNKTNELVALFSSGMSLARVSAPILALVVLISLVSFWMGDRLLPTIIKKKNYIYFVEIEKKPGLYSTIKTNKIWYRSKNILFNIQTLQVEKKEAQGISLYYFDQNWDLRQMIFADKTQMKGSEWTLKDGSVTLFSEETGAPMTQAFTSKKVIMNEEVSDLQASAGSSSILSLKDLRKFIKKNKEAGLETLQYEVDYHSKFSFAFAAFVMSFLGIPFTVTRGRSGGFALNAGLCVGLAFVYWTFYSSGITLGKYGAISPILATWVPNISILGLSFGLLVRLRR